MITDDENGRCIIFVRTPSPRAFGLSSNIWTSSARKRRISKILNRRRSGPNNSLFSAKTEFWRSVDPWHSQTSSLLTEGPGSGLERRRERPGRWPGTNTGTVSTFSFLGDHYWTKSWVCYFYAHNRNFKMIHFVKKTKLINLIGPVVVNIAKRPAFSLFNVCLLSLPVE